MRKALVVARREYNAAVRTKAFLISLLIMPLLMGGSILVQMLVGKYRDTAARKVAVIDRTPGRSLVGALQAAVAAYNTTTVDADGKLVKPPLALEVVEPGPAEEQRFALSERARKGELAGFLEIGADVAKLAPSKGDSAAVRYQSDRLAEREVPELARQAISEKVRELRAQQAQVPEDKVRLIVRPVQLESKGLSERDAGGQVKDASEESRVASFVAPMVLMILMFMLTLMTATPLMQGVVEEKMQRIAEVLLGSASPFQLMLGKLLGMAGVSLTIAVVYLGGAYWAAHHFGVAGHVTPALIGWFVFYQALASLMYGSLFIAVGAACTDMRETQNLLWPVMLLASAPMFVLSNVLREPNSAVVTALSFFPFATPTLMIGRQAQPQGVPPWQPFAAGMGVLLATLLCVWVAGRIFRVGMLMQGKGASPVEMARWVLRG